MTSDSHSKKETVYVAITIDEDGNLLGAGAAEASDPSAEATDAARARASLAMQNDKARRAGELS